ncbi:MAG: DNA polymerase III subunit gamma/tau [Candidatus Dormibacteria bacterium]
MTALYRRYRSARFGDLVGQAHVARTLLNEVLSDRLAHAYLLTGIRGTGKTSTARILARALNCLAPVGGEPCNECAACAEITGGAAVDVLEIDAASNRGIDEMRDLREKVKFMPASLRRKVYIIDEAHMLTAEAWNAFLKTLEEPPAHVLFILCTTEPHKVPETVRSRVQRFDFRRVSESDIHAHLERIAIGEEVEVDAPAVDLIARAAQGSVRDALSLLDQALAVGDRPVTAAVARDALGLADPQSIRDLLLALAGSDAAAALRAAGAIFGAGADPRQLLRECGRLARAAELCAVGFPEGAGVRGDEEELSRQLGSAAASGFWLGALELFGTIELELRQPVDARLQVETGLLRLCRGGAVNVGALEARVVALEAQLSAGTPPPGVDPVRPQLPVAVPAPAPTPGRPAAALSPDPTPADGAPAALRATVAAAAAPDVALEGLTTLNAWEASWTALIEAANRRNSMVAGILRGCRPLGASAEELVVGAPFQFHLNKLREPANAAILDGAATDLAGSPRRVRAEFSGGEAVAADPEAVDTTQAALAAFAGSRVTSTRMRDPAEVDPTAGGSPG